MPPPSVIAVSTLREARSTTMSWEPLPNITLPTELTDETVAQLLECLYELARGLENHYAAQLYRHYHPCDERQQPLWSDDAPPF